MYNFQVVTWGEQEREREEEEEKEVRGSERGRKRGVLVGDWSATGADVASAVVLRDRERDGASERRAGRASGRYKCRRWRVNYNVLVVSFGTQGAESRKESLPGTERLTRIQLQPNIRSHEVLSSARLSPDAARITHGHTYTPYIHTYVHTHTHSLQVSSSTLALGLRGPSVQSESLSLYP